MLPESDPTQKRRWIVTWWERDKAMEQPELAGLLFSYQHGINLYVIERWVWEPGAVTRCVSLGTRVVRYMMSL